MNRFPAPTRRLPANLAYAVAAPLCSAVVVAIAAAIALAAPGGGDEAQTDSCRSPTARELRDDRIQDQLVQARGGHT